MSESYWNFFDKLATRNRGFYRCNGELNLEIEDYQTTFGGSIEDFRSNFLLKISKKTIFHSLENSQKKLIINVLFDCSKITTTLLFKL